MFSRIFIALVMLLAGTRGAVACSVAATSFDDQLKRADTVFIGSVRVVDNGLATFVAEKGIQKIKDGQTLDVEVVHNTCGYDFKPGQRWLYLGNSAPAGSLMLQDEYGRVVADNIAFAKKQFGDIPEDGSEVRSGTLEGTCAPWDGSAIAIKLDNGVSASVYVSGAELDKKGENEVVSYPANGKPERGAGDIVLCPQPKPGQSENLPCAARQGTIYIGGVTPTDVTGYIEINDGEYHSRHVFHVKRIAKRVVCG